MQVLIVHACSDPYSHTDFGLHRSMVEGDWSANDLASTKKDYLIAFERKSMSKISITHIDIANDGSITVLDNIQGENPPKTRIQINPAAVEAKARRNGGKNKPKAGVSVPNEATLPGTFWTTSTAQGGF